MAISDMVAKIAAARFEENFYQSNIWMSLVDDRSSEIAEHGDTVQIPVDGTEYEANDISSAGGRADATRTQLQWTTPTIVTGNKVDLVANKSYDINVLVGTLQERITRPSFINKASQSTARAFREKLNADLRATFDGVTAARTAISTSSANFGNEAHQNAVDKALRDARVHADYLSWPRGGARVVVVSPAYYDLIDENIIDKNVYFNASSTNDLAAIEGEVMRWRGWTIVMDDSLAEGTANTDDGNHNMYFMNRGQGLAYAGVLMNMTMIRSEIYRGNLVQGLMAYGSAVINPTKLMLQKTSIT